MVCNSLAFVVWLIILIWVPFSFLKISIFKCALWKLCLHFKIVSTMDRTETINYRLSLFFNLSFIGDKWEMINDKSIFFIFSPFLSNFCHFWWLFKGPKYIQHIPLWKMAKIWGKRWRKSLSRIFPVKNWNFQCNFDDFVG